MSKEGVSVTLKGLEDISGLKKGNMVAARLIGAAQEGFHIEAKVLYEVNQHFNINESFHFLMQNMAIGEKNNIKDETETIDTDRILDTAYVRQLIYTEEETKEKKDKQVVSKPVESTPIVDSIPTSEIRFNVLEEYAADYRPTIGYLQFLDKGKFRKLTDYNCWHVE